MLLKTLIVAVFIHCVLAVGPCAPKEDLLQLLTAAHNAPSYHSLTAENKAILVEMIAESQSCQLTAYIYTIGFQHVLNLLDPLEV